MIFFLIDVNVKWLTQANAVGDFREGWAPLILSAQDTQMISKQNLNNIPARTTSDGRRPGK